MARTDPFVALEPVAHVNQQRKAGGVAFGEATFSEALYLLEKLVGVFLLVAVFGRSMRSHTR